VRQASASRSCRNYKRWNGMSGEPIHGGSGRWQYLAPAVHKSVSLLGGVAVVDFPGCTTAVAWPGRPSGHTLEARGQVRRTNPITASGSISRTNNSCRRALPSNSRALNSATDHRAHAWAWRQGRRLSTSHAVRALTSRCFAAGGPDTSSILPRTDRLDHRLAWHGKPTDGAVAHSFAKRTFGHRTCQRQFDL
jgi:hypothetical protein